MEGLRSLVATNASLIETNTRLVAANESLLRTNRTLLDSLSMLVGLHEPRCGMGEGTAYGARTRTRGHEGWHLSH